MLSGIVTYSGNTCNRPITKIKVQILEKDCEIKVDLIKKLQLCGFIKREYFVKKNFRVKMFVIIVSSIKRRLLRHVKGFNSRTTSD